VIHASQLASMQNRDGGWGYRGGSPSVTEPTCFALLALAAAGWGTATAAGVDWLKRRQRADGGWPPRDEVDQSTWVSALPLLLPPKLKEPLNIPRAVEWVSAQSGRESGWLYRLRLLLAGFGSDPQNANPGWPWYPGTAAWVAPTALTLLALEKIQREQPSKALEERCQGGRAYLRVRRCADGGWNHGSTRALGYDGPSYPETTGLALLALHGSPIPAQSMDMARRHYREARSMEALSWLTLGLAAHGEKAPPPADAPYPPRTTLDLALAVVAAAAPERGNIFLE